MSPARLNVKNQTLRDLLKFALNIRDYQSNGGPGWIDEDRYDIVASTGGETKMAKKRLMLQALLAERFGLATHSETREISGYALVIAKGGPKFGVTKSEQGSLMLGRNPRGLRTLTARKSQMPALAAILSDVLGRPVIDATGLTESYDLTMEWTPDIGEAPLSRKGSASGEPVVDSGSDGPSIFSAMQEQLGLKLEGRKVPAQITVVDRVQKPVLD